MTLVLYTPGHCNNAPVRGHQDGTHRNSKSEARAAAYLPEPGAISILGRGPWLQVPPTITSRDTVFLSLLF